MVSASFKIFKKEFREYGDYFYTFTAFCFIYAFIGQTYVEFGQSMKKEKKDKRVGNPFI